METSDPPAGDGDFLDYVYHHSKTDRALFSRAQILRLIALAGTPSPREDQLPAWCVMYPDSAHPLVERARKRHLTQKAHDAAFCRLLVGTVPEEGEADHLRHLQEIWLRRLGLEVSTAEALAVWRRFQAQSGGGQTVNEEVALEAYKSFFDSPPTNLEGK